MKNISAGMTGAEFISTLNNVRKEYNVKDYGVTGNGSDDDTVALQDLVNTICAGVQNARVYFPAGIYIIAGAIQTTVNTILYNSQIYIPAKNVTDTGRISIEFVGEAMPNFTQSAGVGNAISPNGGTIIRSTLINDVDGGAIICTRGPDSNYSNFNYNQISFRDIAFQYTPNGSHACTISGINASKSANFCAKNVVIYPYNLNLKNSGTPINNCIGINTPSVDGDMMNVLENCCVGGFYDGFRFGDHTSLKDCQAHVCMYGFCFTYNRLLDVSTKIEALWCAWAVRFYGASTSYVNIANLVIEYDLSPGGAWFDYQGTVYDHGNKGIGVIRYNFHPRDLGESDPYFFVIDGGANLRCQPIIFNSASDYTVTGADDAAKLASLMAILKAQGHITY